ncbi:hypothetical protein JTB14_024379 [Gonioctena quinquepunctata]|nr:hypothetical protein JTB14_024379 [Gonioctena quinquepunctata]
MNEDFCKLRSKICLFPDLSKKYPELKNHYKELNKQYSLELSKAKRSHIDNKINYSTNKTKATWNIISEIQGKKKAANLKITENDEQLDDEVVANNFLGHFSLATDEGGNDVECLMSNIQINDKSFFFGAGD